MSPQVTFKSNEDKAPEAALQAAPRLCDAIARPYTPSHGSLPSLLPQRPVGLQDLGPAAALRVIGPEREKWLQGMQSNDVSAAPVGGAVAGLFLGGKGRLVAPGLLWRQAEDVIVTTEPQLIDGLRAHLDKLLIMEDCEIVDAPALHRLRFFPADKAPDVAPHITGSWQPLGFELLLPENEASPLLATLPRASGVEAWRVAIGVPEWGKDLGEETTPIEAGLDPMLSFSKGCYVGQEVVAMATYRGRVAWNLVRLEVAGDAPAVGTPIDPQRGPRGRVTSATRIGSNAVLLGWVHKELIVPGAQVTLGDGRTARVLGLPYGSLPGAGVCA